jgi:hypothetical protein
MRSKCLPAFVILLTTLCRAEKTDRIIVKSVSYDRKSVTVNVGPAVFNPFTGEYDAGYRGDILGCNTEEPTCYGPEQGDRGVIVDGPHVYEGPNMTIRWTEGRVTATYALHEEY